MVECEFQFPMWNSELTVKFLVECKIHSRFSVECETQVGLNGKYKVECEYVKHEIQGRMWNLG